MNIIYMATLRLRYWTWIHLHCHHRHHPHHLHHNHHHCHPPHPVSVSLSPMSGRSTQAISPFNRPLSLFDSTNASVKYYISTRIMCQRLIRANNPYIFVSTQIFWILRYKSMSLSKLFRSQNFCVKNISSALSIMLCHPGHPILTTAAILFSTHVCSSQTQHWARSSKQCPSALVTPALDKWAQRLTGQPWNGPFQLL